MYVIQTKTGSETQTALALVKNGYDARVPEKIMQLRRHGKFVYQKYAIFPSYIFINADKIEPDMYHEIKNTDGVINFLGKGTPTKMSRIEDIYINILWNEGQPIAPSKIYRTVTGTVMVMSGILRKFPADMIKVDIRQRRAVITVSILGASKRITLPIETI